MLNLQLINDEINIVKTPIIFEISQAKSDNDLYTYQYSKLSRMHLLSDIMNSSSIHLEVTSCQAFLICHRNNNPSAVDHVSKLFLKCC